MSVLNEIIDSLSAVEVPPWFAHAVKKQNQGRATARDVDALTQRSRQFVDWVSHSTEVDLRALMKAELILLETPLPEAQAASHKGENYILLHQGFLGLLSFAADAMVLMNVCRSIEPHVTAKDLAAHGLARWPTVEMVAGLSSAVTYAYFVQPLQLPVLDSRKISDKYTSFMMHLTSCCELFAIMHEAAHIQLGHLSAHPAQATIRSEFLLPEPTSLEKSQELEADAFAFAAVDGEGRNTMGYGAFQYLRILGTSEFLAPPSQSSHPMAINRAHAILDTFGSTFSESVRRVGQNTIEFLQQDYAEFHPESVDPHTGRVLSLREKLRALAFDVAPDRASWLLWRMGQFARAFAANRPELV